MIFGYLIMKNDNKEFVSIAKDQVITLKDKNLALKFYDKKSATIFLSYLCNRYKKDPTQFKVGAG